jgi:peptidoglycan/LPS O-acetylase OafA/YrhL
MTATSTAPPPNPRSMGVDLLRAVCILYVVGYWHLIPYTTALPGYSNWFTEGLKYVAMATFVFCSGFLLGRHDVTLDRRGLLSFYQRRLLRIYPLYLVALILFGLVGLASLTQIINGALLISMFNPPAMPTLWFITMIMVFYLIAPLLIRCAGNPLAIILAGGALFLALIAEHLLVKQIDLRILMYLPIFVLGILYRRQPTLRGLLERYKWVLLLLMALMLPLSRVGNEWSLTGAITIVPLILVSGPAMFLFADRVASLLHGPTIAFLAYASFGFYLFHRLVFKAAIALYFPGQGWDQVMYLLLVAVPISILVGYGVQRGYDRLPGSRIPSAK